MNQFLVYITEIVDGGQIIRSRIELCHMCPPVATQDFFHAPVLLGMAQVAVSFSEGPKPKVDLVEMRLVEGGGAV